MNPQYEAHERLCKSIGAMAKENEDLKQHITQLENRLRALWDKYDGDRKHYMDRIKRLEEALSRIANQDYRGNRSTESQIAFEALKEAKP